MGKWNKAPPEVSEEFMQNQQRRKQMIVQAAKRRRQKQKKMQDQAEIQRKNQEDALVKHKQDKKDAYIKYLRNNMHDKYENMKHNEKINQPEIRSKSKWKKDTIQSESQLKNQSNLQSLNLQVNIQNKRRNIQNRTYAKPGGQVVRNQPVVQNLTKQPSSYTNQYNVGNRNLKDVHLDKLQSNYQPKQTEKRRMLENQFQNLWKQENQVPQKQIEYELSMGESVFDDLIGSRLLDSLDLDLDTVSRGKRLDKKIKNQNYNFKKDQHKQINEIKNLIGYQSILMSVDQRSEMIKKYSEFMTNQVQPPRKTEQINTKDVSKQKNHKNPRSTKQSKPQPISKPLNQGQVFNQLKNKKEGKILNWANQQVEQADDLFSNCSTSKKSKTRGFQMLKDINKQIQAQGKKTSQPPAPSSIPSNQLIDMKKKQRPLQTIPQKKINVSRERLRQRSYEKKNPIQQVNIPQNNNQNRSHEIKRSVSKQKIVEVRKSRTNRLNSAQNNASNQVRKNIRQNSKERVNKTATNSFKQNRITSGQNNMTQPRDRNERGRSLSRDQPNSVSSKEVPVYTATGGYSKAIQVRKQAPATKPQSINPFANKLAHLPPRPYQNMDQVTVATQDQLFQIQSFIKNELLTLNKQERQVQQQLKNIHVQNKDKIKDIQKKYEIRTDYKHSRQLKVKGEDGSDQIDEEIESNPASYKQLYKKQTQDQLQDSIQRLDDMLLRREITQKQRDSRVKEESNMSQATSRSIINPMCDPITLHKQVLQLAQNLSRFEGQPDNIQTGYGAKLRMQKRSASKQKKPEQKVKQSSRMKQNQIDLSQSQDVNYSELNSNQKQSKVSKVSRPPQLDYIQQNYFMPPSHNLSDLLDDQLQDSIEKGKIEVNQRLKRMLLD